MSRSHDALLVDLDGTLITESGSVHPATAAALQRAEALGVPIMIATGRSTISTRPVVETLGLRTPALVFNGAGLYCPVRARMLEERVLSNRTLKKAIEFGRARDLVTVLMTADKKLASPPRDDVERAALAGLHQLEIVPWKDLALEFVIRVTYFSRDHDTSVALAHDVERAIDEPVYITHFPLNALASHRQNPLAVLDLHPPCRGKAEGVRMLGELFDIAPERIVAVGDASNDVPMFLAAGLAVAMKRSMPEALTAADRVIGDNDGPAIAELVEELFLSGARSSEPSNEPSNERTRT